MTKITPAQLIRILPGSVKVADQFAPALSAAMAKFKINTPQRMAAFLANVGHESGQLTTMVENLNYSAQGLANTWPSRYAVDSKARPLVPNTLATRLARKPQEIANNVYAGRMGNGVETTGDGWRYRGRGPIQTTGKSNYTATGKAIGQDLVARPELLEQPEHGAMAAAWFWSSNGLNELADAGKLEAITRRINGGMNGHDERLRFYRHALAVLS